VTATRRVDANDTNGFWLSLDDVQSIRNIYLEAVNSNISQYDQKNIKEIRDELAKHIQNFVHYIFDHGSFVNLLMKQVLDTNKFERLHRFHKVCIELELILVDLFQSEFSQFQNSVNDLLNALLEEVSTFTFSDVSGLDLRILNFPNGVLQFYDRYISNCHQLLQKHQFQFMTPPDESPSFTKIRLMLFQRMITVLKVMIDFEFSRRRLKHYHEEREAIWNANENIPSLDFEKLLLVDIDDKINGGPMSPIANQHAISMNEVVEVFGKSFASFPDVQAILKDDVLSIIKLLKY
jgi:hypothetical protein